MKKLEYIVFAGSFALFIIFGFMLVMALLKLNLISIMLCLAMTSGAYGISKKFKDRVYSKPERKFKSRFRKYN